MKISNIFRRKSSREVAKDRLKILLISDRVNCSPEMMEMIKNDIAKVISKYIYLLRSAQDCRRPFGERADRGYG